MEARLIVMALVCLCIAQVAFAMDQNFAFKAAKDRHRFEKLIKETRCVVCQNQSLFDSNSALAGDMRRQIHTMINAGMKNSQIKNYLRDRYGDSILFMPPFRAGTILLWFGPILMLGGAAYTYRWALRRRRTYGGYYAC